MQFGLATAAYRASAIFSETQLVSDISLNHPLALLSCAAHVDEDYSAGPEINEPVRERSNRHSSESSTLEIDVYVWRYALIVVHAGNERTNSI